MSMMTLICAIISFCITVFSGKYIIKKLQLLNFGQTIYEEGPSWHKGKNGTPTMGGIMFILGIVLSSLVVIIFYAVRYGGFSAGADLVPIIAGILTALGFSLIGFIDDYIKVVKKRNLGLTAIQKLIFQFLIAGVFIYTLEFSGVIDTSEILLPFFGEVNLGWVYYPIAAVSIVFIVNAVNLTDGLDGFAASVTSVCSIGYLVIAVLLEKTLTASVSAALLGGVLGFLVYNRYPAKVFMGDTGSMFLGGMVVVLAFTMRYPGLIFLMGGLYIIEALSVCLQVFWYKLTKTRIFLMSPIHHHYEKKGYSENKIVKLFSAIELIFVIVAVLGTVIRI